MTTHQPFTTMMTIALLMVLPVCTRAGNAAVRSFSNYSVALRAQSDTLPPKATNATTDATTDQTDALIKTIPKARRQAIPIPVSLQVKPIILVKPGILKPIIKVLH